MSVGGANLFYADDDFTDPWESRETILLQPKLFGDHTQLRAWVPTLGRDYRVIRLDRRGCGLSEPPKLGYEFTLDSIVADFIGFLDALGLERVHYVGQSNGGVFGLALAAKHPERVSSLVLVTTPCSLPARAHEGNLREGYPDGPSAVMAMGTWLYVQGRDELRWYSGSDTRSRRQRLRDLYFRERFALAAPHVVASLIRMVTSPAYNVTSLLTRIQAPTLLLSAENDTVIASEEQAFMARTIPNCRQVILEGAEHPIALDDPERCAAEALKFLRSLTREPDHGVRTESLNSGPTAQSG